MFDYNGFEKLAIVTTMHEVLRKRYEEIGRYACAADTVSLFGPQAFSLFVQGSGGSLTTAYALTLHQHFTSPRSRGYGRIRRCCVHLAPARNVDILASNSASNLLSVLCRHRALGGTLSSSGRSYALSTERRRLLGFVTLFTRAYATEFGCDADWQESVDSVEPLLRNTSAVLEAWQTAMEPRPRPALQSLHRTLLHCPPTHVLAGPLRHPQRIHHLHVLSVRASAIGRKMYHLRLPHRHRAPALRLTLIHSQQNPCTLQLRRRHRTTRARLQHRFQLIPLILS